MCPDFLFKVLLVMFQLKINRRILDSQPSQPGKRPHQADGIFRKFPFLIAVDAHDADSFFPDGYGKA
ncbi:MAG: hypothetical protein C4518_12745 [Desulfobacteraceae bacterium]|nr:MAG: hypothetical protein C4518_12745 [Desulfobacteraceae bacterium]